MHPRRHLLALLVFATPLTGLAATVATNQTVTPNNNGTLLTGTGPATGFVTATDDDRPGATGDQVAIKVRNRGGDPPIINGDRYTIRNNPNPIPLVADPDNFVVDFQFTPGGTDQSDYADYAYQISFDFNPGPGTAFTPTGPIPIFNSSGQPIDPGSFFSTGIGSVPFVVSASIDISGSPSVFSQSVASIYAVPGEYTVRFDVLDAGNLIASAELVAVVVPEPLTLLGGSVLLGLIGTRRRR